MFRKKTRQLSSSTSVKTSQEERSTNLWQQLTESEQEVAKGGFSFPGFPGGPVRPGVINTNVNT